MAFAGAENGLPVGGLKADKPLSWLTQRHREDAAELPLLGTFDRHRQSPRWTVHPWIGDGKIGLYLLRTWWTFVYSRCRQSTSPPTPAYGRQRSLITPREVEMNRHTTTRHTATLAELTVFCRCADRRLADSRPHEADRVGWPIACRCT